MHAPIYIRDIAALTAAVGLLVSASGPLFVLVVFLAFVSMLLMVGTYGWSMSCRLHPKVRRYKTHRCMLPIGLLCAALLLAFFCMFIAPFVPQIGRGTPTQDYIGRTAAASVLGLIAASLAIHWLEISRCLPKTDLVLARAAWVALAGMLGGIVAVQFLTGATFENGCHWIIITGLAFAYLTIVYCPVRDEMDYLGEPSIERKFAMRSSLPTTQTRELR